jgi:hypothetical protein
MRSISKILKKTPPPQPKLFGGGGGGFGTVAKIDPCNRVIGSTLQSSFFSPEGSSVRFAGFSHPNVDQTPTGDTLLTGRYAAVMAYTCSDTGQSSCSRPPAALVQVGLPGLGQLVNTGGPPCWSRPTALILDYLPGLGVLI